jgi:DNA-binding transcriptional ArsR family regulator
MSPAPDAPEPAPIFAALGDPTRLALVATLADGRPRSVTQLSSGSRLTRQAVTKHLRVLEAAGVVGSARLGRETRFAFRPERLTAARDYLDEIGRQWEAALDRLKAFVEAERDREGHDPSR